MPREHEWDSRWWSPIINAEHLRMREAAGVDRPDGVPDLRHRGPAARSTSVQRTCVAQCDVAVGKVIYTPVLDANGGFRSDLTVMRLGDDHFRVVTGGAHGMADRKWFADHLAGDGHDLTDQHRRRLDHRPLGPEGARHPRLAHRRRRLRRGLRDAVVPRDPGRRRATVLASRISYVGELGWELYVADGRRRRALGGAARHRRRPRHRAGRHRRLRHDRPDREGLPRLRLRARRRAHDRRGRHAAAQGQGRRLRRQGGLPRAARGRPRRPCSAR